MDFLISCRRALSPVSGRPLSSLPKPSHPPPNRYRKLTIATANMTDKTFTLNNGVSIPAVGLGTPPLPPSPPLPPPHIALTTLTPRDMAIRAGQCQVGRLARHPLRLPPHRRRLLLRQRGRGRPGHPGGAGVGRRPARGPVRRVQGVDDVQHARRGGAGQELEGPRGGLCGFVSGGELSSLARPCVRVVDDGGC